MRPGATERTQQCRRCRRGHNRESDMTPASKVKPGTWKRGWVCPSCVAYLNGSTMKCLEDSKSKPLDISKPKHVEVS
jgi:hypothetical protein